MLTLVAAVLVYDLCDAALDKAPLDICDLWSPCSESLYVRSETKVENDMLVFK